MKRLLLILLAALLAGCSSSTPTTGDKSKKITWSEYQKMDAEQKNDPYVLDNLDDEAKKKLSEAQRKKKR